MSRLDEILTIVSATEESAYDDLAELLKPESLNRDNAGEIYEAMLGYDPTSYFDKKEIADKVHTFATDTDMPEDVASVVLEDEIRISNSAYEKFDDRRSDFMDEVVEEAITEATGWSSTDTDDVDVDDEYDDE